MSQHDQVIDNGSGAVVRADINSAYAAVWSLSSGPSSPGTTQAYMWWADTTNGQLKQRNAGNTAWAVRSTLSSDGVFHRTTGYTVAAGDYGKLITVDASGGAFTLSLLTAANAGDGFVFAVRKTEADTSGNAVTIDPNAAELIDGALTIALLRPGESALVWCNGSAWHTVGNTIDLASYREPNSYTKAQNFAATGLTDAASIAWDLESNQVASVTLGGNRTLAAPTNMLNGGYYSLLVRQDATGNRTLAYNAVYKWPGGLAPVLSTGANDIDLLVFYSDGAGMYGKAQLDFS